MSTTVGAAPVPGRQERRLGWWRRVLGPFAFVALAVLVGCLILGGGLAVRYAFITSPDQAAVRRAPRISDTSFERSASAACLQAVRAFDTATTLGKAPTQAEAGAFLDSIATTFDALVVKLEAIPVAAVDQPAVDAWIAEWTAYNAFGHHYAAAVTKGQERDLVTGDSRRIGDIRRRRNGFARANHVSACAFN